MYTWCKETLMCICIFKKRSKKETRATNEQRNIHMCISAVIIEKYIK